MLNRVKVEFKCIRNDFLRPKIKLTAETSQEYNIMERYLETLQQTGSQQLHRWWCLD